MHYFDQVHPEEAAMTSVPALRCAELIYDSDITKRAFLHSCDMHRREIRKGTIQTLMTVFRCRAIEAYPRSEIYLFAEYRIE